MKTLVLIATATLTFAQTRVASAATNATSTNFSKAGEAGYVPLPGSSIIIKGCPSGTTPVKYPEAFPDITSRFALATLDASGGAKYGPVAATAKNSQYRATVDYGNTDAVPVTMWIKETLSNDEPSYDVRRANPNDTAFTEVVIPVLIGVAFRVSADFVALDAKAEVSGLGVIGANAALSRLRGSLMVETLGVSGEAMAASIPIPSKLDQSTVESAILSVGAGRAYMYGNDSAKLAISPRIVGMISPGNNPRLVSLIHAELVRGSVEWQRSCR